MRCMIFFVITISPGLVYRASLLAIVGQFCYDSVYEYMNLIFVCLIVPCLIWSTCPDAIPKACNSFFVVANAAVRGSLNRLPVS